MFSNLIFIEIDCIFFSLDEICKSTGMLIIKLIVRAQSIDLAMILLSQSISMWNVFNSISTIHTIKILITSMEFDVINKLSMNILMTFQKRVFIHVAAGKERREKTNWNTANCQCLLAMWTVQKILWLSEQNIFESVMSRKWTNKRRRKLTKFIELCWIFIWNWWRFNGLKWCFWNFAGAL